jgi:hypothetical protein
MSCGLLRLVSSAPAEVAQAESLEAIAHRRQSSSPCLLPLQLTSQCVNSAASSRSTLISARDAARECALADFGRKATTRASRRLGYGASARLEHHAARQLRINKKYISILGGMPGLLDLADWKM